MNNSNFAYDCCNNLDNCQFIPIFDELKDVMYLKRCYNYFDQKVSKFVTADSIKQETDEKYHDSIMKVERAESMEAAEKYKKKKEKKKNFIWLCRKTWGRMHTCRNDKIKSLIDFDEEYSSGVKSLAVKKLKKFRFVRYRYHQ